MRRLSLPISYSRHFFATATIPLRTLIPQKISKTYTQNQVYLTHPRLTWRPILIEMRLPVSKKLVKKGTKTINFPICLKQLPHQLALKLRIKFTSNFVIILLLACHEQPQNTNEIHSFRKTKISTIRLSPQFSVSSADILWNVSTHIVFISCYVSQTSPGRQSMHSIDLQ